MYLDPTLTHIVLHHRIVVSTSARTASVLNKDPLWPTSYSAILTTKRVLVPEKYGLLNHTVADWGSDSPRRADTPRRRKTLKQYKCEAVRMGHLCIWL